MAIESFSIKEEKVHFWTQTYDICMYRLAVHIQFFYTCTVKLNFNILKLIHCKLKTRVTNVFVINKLTFLFTFLQYIVQYCNPLSYVQYIQYKIIKTKVPKTITAVLK